MATAPEYSMFALASLSYHDYEGLAVNHEEKLRLRREKRRKEAEDAKRRIRMAVAQHYM